MDPQPYAFQFDSLLEIYLSIIAFFFFFLESQRKYLTFGAASSWKPLFLNGTALVNLSYPILSPVSITSVKSRKIGMLNSAQLLKL